MLSIQPTQVRKHKWRLAQLAETAFSMLKVCILMVAYLILNTSDDTRESTHPWRASLHIETLNGFLAENIHLYSSRWRLNVWKGSRESLKHAELIHRFCLNNWGNRKTFIKAPADFSKAVSLIGKRSHLPWLLEGLLFKRKRMQFICSTHTVRRAAVFP